MSASRLLSLFVQIIQLATDFLSITDANHGVFSTCKELDAFRNSEWLPQNIDKTTRLGLLVALSREGKLTNVRTLDLICEATQRADSPHVLHIRVKPMEKQGRASFHCSTIMLERLSGFVDLHFTPSADFSSLRECKLEDPAITIISNSNKEGMNTMFPVLQHLELYLARSEEVAITAIQTLFEHSKCGLKSIDLETGGHIPLIVIIRALDGTPSASTLSVIKGVIPEDTQGGNDALVETFRSTMQPLGRLLSSLEFEQTDESSELTRNTLTDFLACARPAIQLRSALCGAQMQTALPVAMTRSNEVLKELRDATEEEHRVAAAVTEGPIDSDFMGIYREACRFISKGFPWRFEDATELRVEDGDEDGNVDYLDDTVAVFAGRVFPNVKKVLVLEFSEDIHDIFHRRVSELARVASHLPKLEQVELHTCTCGYSEVSIFPSYMIPLTSLLNRVTEGPLSYTIALGDPSEATEEEDDDEDYITANITLGHLQEIRTLLSVFPIVQIVDERTTTDCTDVSSYQRCFITLLELPESRLPTSLRMSYERSGRRGDAVAAKACIARIRRLASSPGWRFFTNGRAAHAEGFKLWVTYNRNSNPRNVRQRTF